MNRIRELLGAKKQALNTVRDGDVHRSDSDGIQPCKEDRQSQATDGHSKRKSS
ncbi:Uncharacterised protein [Vibrio cholerae]|uniref:Uncharacterized protein n=1 Tax=Vibrio cholerae TaxID=666 RepID=A0A655YX62_VIBCL|nr:Uncharacterised protein [Vibrio cholerae]